MAVVVQVKSEPFYYAYILLKLIPYNTADTSFSNKV